MSGNTKVTATNQGAGGHRQTVYIPGEQENIRRKGSRSPAEVKGRKKKLEKRLYSGLL